MAQPMNKQEFDPFRRDAAEVRIDDGTGLGLQPPGDLEDRSKGAAFSGNAVIGRDDPMQDALLIADKQMLEIDDGAGDDGRRPIGRTAVGVDQHCPAAGEVFGKAHAHGPHDMSHRIGIVVAGDSDENVR